MDCWDVLEIPQDSDLKTVKKAYAQKLKLTKPDEDPDGFKLLHTAYKKACKFAKFHARKAQEESNLETVSETAEVGSNSLSELTEPVAIEPIVIEAQDTELPLAIDTPNANIEISPIANEQEWPPHSQIDQVSVSYTLHLEPAVSDQHPNDVPPWHTDHTEERLIEEVDVLIKDASKVNRIEAWQEILDSPLLYEIQFKAWFTLAIFQEVITNLKGNKKALMKASTLKFLDDHFLWTQQMDRLEQHFDYADIDLFISGMRTPWEQFANTHLSPKQHRGEMEYANYFRKLGACIIDFALFVLVVIGVVSVNEYLPETSRLEFDTGLVLVILWALFLFPVMEATPFQGSPGKILMGMKVVSPDGKRLNIVHSVFRFMLFGVCTAAFKFTVWINLFINDGRLLHDRLSNSIVVRK